MHRFFDCVKKCGFKGLGVFIGDLPLPGNNELKKEKKIIKSWGSIKSTGEKRIFPAHASSFELKFSCFTFFI